MNVSTTQKLFLPASDENGHNNHIHYSCEPTAFQTNLSCLFIEMQTRKKGEKGLFGMIVEIGVLDKLSNFEICQSDEGQGLKEEGYR